MLKRFVMFLLCLSALWACTDEDVTVVEQNDLDRMVEITINAGVDAEGSTRTFIAASGDNFWKVGDSIGVWVLNDAGGVTGPQPYKFKVTEVKSDQTKCTLQGKVPAQYENNRLAAIYPYQADATLAKVDKFDVPAINNRGVLERVSDENYKYYFSANVPTIQKAVKGSYDPEAYISIAVMDEAGADLNFRNACTLIKFTAPSNTGKDITAVTLETRENEDFDDEVDYLTGNFKIHYAPQYENAPDGYSFTPDGENNKSSLLVANMETKSNNQTYVKLQAPEGEFLEPGEVYYMVVRNFVSFTSLYIKKGVDLPSTGSTAYYRDATWAYYLDRYGYMEQVAESGDEIAPTGSGKGFSFSDAITGTLSLVEKYFEGGPMLATGHVLQFFASDGTSCTRKFKATTNTTSETKRLYMIMINETDDHWYWGGTLTTISSTTGFNFERNTYKPLTFADNSSNWSGKFQ
ncbi:MAG: hypothetical protein II950_06775 [Prevotella sp.]|nr:hypothetical protein [Prevotella sp.]